MSQLGMRRFAYVSATGENARLLDAVALHLFAHHPHQSTKMSAAAVAHPDAHMNGHDAANGNGYHPDAPKEPKFASGLILPPPEIKCACILC